jgi:copper resistance protein D
LASLIDIFGFLAVILRGICLSLECLLIGGAVYYLWACYRPRENEALAKGFARRLLFGSAFTMLLAQAFWLSVNSAILQDTTGISWSEVFQAEFFLAGVIQIAGAILFLLLAMRRRPRMNTAALVSASILELLGSVLTSHSTARLDHRLVLMAVTGGHQLGAAVWIGALPFLLWSVVHLETREDRAVVAARYTRQAVIGVTLLLGAGLVLAFVYIRSFPLLYGTAYGVMTVAKAILLAILLFLGWQNNGIVGRRLIDGTWRLRLRRFSEVEIGIGFTTILAAASLTSQPPAIDMKADRVAASTIVTRFTPQIPSMKTPALGDLSPATPLNADEAKAFGKSPLDTDIPGAGLGIPDKPSDIAWSEYNHNWAGLIVFLAGTLAFVSRFHWGRWAKHWPLAFIGLAVFLLVRADSENWPLGPRGFWESFAIAEVAQHRFFVVLIVLFAIFEWSVQTKRIHSPKAALVFPAVCVLGGTLLLAHNHSLTKVQEQLLAELSHTPIAILGLVAGWARWLEIRFPERPPKWAANLWPICFMAIGYFLLSYREH